MQTALVDQSAFSFFLSAKTAVAVPVPTACQELHNALIQASLDPAVRSIEFVPSPQVRQAPVGQDTIVIVRDDGRFRLDVVAARAWHPTNSVTSAAAGTQNLPVIVVTDEDIHHERYANARAVWEYRRTHVGVASRMQILHVLEEDGPMPLISLLRALRCDEDPLPTVMSLACSNAIQLDLVSRALGPRTIVRSRA